MSIVVFEHSDLSGSGRFGEMLRNYGHRLDVRRLHHGDPVPHDLDDVDGIVSCGGSPSVVDDREPWLASELDYLRRARELDVPMVGLCLGCQIFARAFGGEVAKLAPKPEIGWHPVHLTTGGMNDIVHAGVGWTTMQMQWHFDHVSKVPSGAQVLARSAACPVQAWSLGVRVYAFQFHPEVNRADIEAWADDSPGDPDLAGLTREQLSRDTDQHLPHRMRVGARLFEALALLVMPVDRRFAGITKDLHH